METLDSDVVAGGEEGRPLQDILDNGYDFSIGQTISSAFDLYKANFGPFFVSYLLVQLIGGLGSIFTIGSMMGGFHKVAHNTVRGEDNSTSTLFKGFDEFVEQLVGMLLLMAVIFIPMIVFFVFAGGAGALMGSVAVENEAAAVATSLGIMVLYLCLILVMVLIQTLFVFVIPLIAIGKMKAMDAVKTSFKVAKKKWLKILGYMILMGLIASLGIILCGVGVLLTAPLTLIGNHILYETVFGGKERQGELVGA